MNSLTECERVSSDLGSLNPLQLDEKAETQLFVFPLMSVKVFLDIVGQLRATKPSGILDLNSTCIIDSMIALPKLYTKLLITL